MVCLGHWWKPGDQDTEFSQRRHGLQLLPEPGAYRPALQLTRNPMPPVNTWDLLLKSLPWERCKVAPTLFPRSQRQANKAHSGKPIHLEGFLSELRWEVTGMWAPLPQFAAPEKPYRARKRPPHTIAYWLAPPTLHLPLHTLPPLPGQSNRGSCRVSRAFCVLLLSGCEPLISQLRWSFARGCSWSCQDDRCLPHRPITHGKNKWI